MTRKHSPTLVTLYAVVRTWAINDTSIRIVSFPALEFPSCYEVVERTDGFYLTRIDKSRMDELFVGVNAQIALNYFQTYLARQLVAIRRHEHEHERLYELAESLKAEHPLPPHPTPSLSRMCDLIMEPNEAVDAGR